MILLSNGINFIGNKYVKSEITVTCIYTRRKAVLIFALNV